MIALPSFLAAIDMTQAKPISGENAASEGSGNSGIDGFAALIAQLMQILPMPNGSSADAPVGEEGGAGNLPTGKILPVDGGNLAAATAGQIVGEAATGPVPRPGAVGSMHSSATIISLQQAQPALPAQQSVPLALGTADTEGTQVAVKEGAAAASFSPTPRSDQIRMTVSLAPLETTALRVAAPQDVFAPVEKQLSAAIGSIPKTAGEPVPASPQPQLASLADRVPRSDGRVAATFAAEPKQAGRDPQPPAAISSERPQPVRSSSLEKDASSGDRSGRAFGPESATGAARTLASPESAKPFAMPAFAPLEAAAANRGDGLRVAAATTASAMSSVEGIERLVERLSVAREFDTKSASIAVTHREFGALTVTFDYARNGLDVEIAAKDNDMQRALALAVAADRPTGRAGEPPQQSLPQTSQTNFAASERGAGTAGQGANSSGTASSDGRAQGEGSQHQRDRQLASSAQDPRNPARPAPGDDALYA